MSPRWEARLESNTLTQERVSQPEGAGSRTSNLAPVSFGAKFQIRDSAGTRQPSLGTILGVFPTSGTGNLQTRGFTGDLRLAADWYLTRSLSLNPNVGVAFYANNESGRFLARLFALTLNYFNAAKTINPFVDLGVQVPETTAAGSSLIIDIGIAWLAGRNVQVDVSVGAGPHGWTPPQRFFSVGISLRFRTQNGETSPVQRPESLAPRSSSEASA